MNRSLKPLEQKGVFFVGVNAVAMDEKIAEIKSYELAMDAQPSLVTLSNSGVPAYLTTEIHPAVIKAIVAKNAAVLAVGKETQYGSRVNSTLMMKVVENTGYVSAYGDYNEAGHSDSNVSFPQRQSFHYQTMTKWGDLEIQRMASTLIDWSAQKSKASIDVLNKFQNQSYIFGIDGIQNYGMLNDPSLPANLTPITKAAGGTAWSLSSGAPNATALEVYADFQALFYNLQKRLKGHIDKTTPMTFIMSSGASNAMGFTNQFNQSVSDIILKNYPGVKFRVVPEYETESGEIVQLVVDELDGQITWECGYDEKLRAYPVIALSSSFKQKKSQGTWGTLLYMPMCVQGMLGV